MKVGFTTGSLYKTKISMEDRIKLYYEIGANAIEISFLGYKELFDFIPSEEIIKIIKKFEYISLHAPGMKLRYDKSEETKEVLKRLEWWCNIVPVNGITIHPDRIDDYGVLEETNLPFLVENMDINKKSHTHPRDFKELKKRYDYGFVLDLQHIYEHDKSMNLADEFCSLLKEELGHIHASGQTSEESHTLIYTSDNKIEISEALKKYKNTPIILEGVALNEDVEGSLRKELDYIRSL